MVRECGGVEAWKAGRDAGLSRVGGLAVLDGRVR